MGGVLGSGDTASGDARALERAVPRCSGCGLYGDESLPLVLGRGDEGGLGWAEKRPVRERWNGFANGGGSVLGLSSSVVDSSSCCPNWLSCWSSSSSSKKGKDASLSERLL